MLGLTSFLKQINDVDGICSLSHWDLGQMSVGLERGEGRIGMKINTDKAKVVSLTVIELCLSVLMCRA